MKKYLILLSAAFVLVTSSFAQTISTGNLVSLTILPGSQPNSVYIAFKSTADITLSRFSTFQFAVGIPSTYTPAPTATIVSSDPLMSYPSAQVSTETQNSVSYTVYSFSGDGAQSGPGILYSANTQYNYAEVFFTGGNFSITDARVMQLPNGGNTNGNDNFYVADRGFDITNQITQFYASNISLYSNDGQGYAGSSYAILSTDITVPVQFTNFSATKKADNAILNWAVANEGIATNHYEVERSLDGVKFTDIATVAVKGNGSANTYTYSDENVSALTASVIYYRIEEVDNDNKTVFTEIKAVNVANGVSINAYPNPAQSTVTVTVNLPEAANVLLSLSDANGKILQQTELTGIKGANLSRLNLGTYASGSYLLKVNSGTDVTTLPIVKQ